MLNIVLDVSARLDYLQMISYCLHDAMSVNDAEQEVGTKGI